MVELMGGAIFGALLMWTYLKSRYELTNKLMEEREKRAFRLNGRLSVRIHKQRLLIKALKTNQPPQPKKVTDRTQPTVSH